MIATVGIGEEGFRAFARPLDGTTAHPLRGPETDDFFGVNEDLRTEAAAHIRCDDPEFVLRAQSMEGRDDEPCHMGVLACGIERVVIIARIIGADGSPGLHGIGDQAVVDNVEGRDVGCRLEGLSGISFITEPPVEHTVIRRYFMHLHL